MKVLVKIFAIYMIALSLVPCGDGGGGVVEIANHFLGVEHQHISDHEQHSNGCGDDTCTPFCICSCCSMALDIPVKLPFQITYLPPTPANLPSDYSDFILTSYQHFIWQPPRLG